MSQAATDHIWPKAITVDKRIVRILSASTYDNFPNALKEIVTNSYDADASSVEIKIDLKNERITIEDDGFGMTESDFSLYLKIAGMKRGKKPRTPSGRLVIGQFGVGFLSVFPFFKNYAIETKQSSSSEILNAEIPCHLYFGSNSVDISEIKVQGGVRQDKSKQNKHYTRIVLSGFTTLSKAFFYPKKKSKPTKNSILNNDSIDILKWRLSEDLPLKYSDSRLNKLFDKFTPNIPFVVKVNNEILLRQSYGKEILEIHKKDFDEVGKIKFRYFICTNREAINTPIEGRYLKIRNLNAGVGDRTTFGLGTEVGGARSRLHWLSGEIHIIEGLNDLITVSRDKFNFDPDYEDLKDMFVKKLSFHSNQLEKEEELKQFVAQSRDENKIKNIKFLAPKTLSKKITTLQKGKVEKEYISKTLQERSKSNDQSMVESELESFQKKMVINGRSYEVILKSWDYKTDLFVACKLEKNKLLINQRYPLFKSIKYTDIFIKLHLWLINSLNKKIITQNSFEKLSKDILEVYKDYIK